MNRPARERRASPWLSLAFALLAALFLSPLFLSPQSASADAPADVGELASDAALPDAPSDYRMEQRGPVRWEFPAQATSVAHDLQEVYTQEWPRVVAELGVEVPDELIIRIGRNPGEMAALAPVHAPPPSYAAGVAYPARGLVLLTLSAPQTWERPDVESVLVHELSHIALHRAVGANPSMPRWFSEGVAIYQAREHSMERTQTLWGGTAGGQLISLERLSQGFPSQPHRVNLAYAQSADFVRWLRGRDRGEEKFHSIVRRLRDGQGFETALSRTYSASMTRLEIDWHENLSERYQALPLLFGSGALWVFAALLVLIAYARRRRKDREKFDEWADEERAALATAQALVASRTARHTVAGPSPSDPDDDNEVLYVVPPEPRRKDALPTVVHDGRSHTLH